MPIVSVIIPVYNSSKYLKRCVQSALNQTLQNIEVILVDDGSTDTSGSICDQFAKEDNRIRVFHQRNGGVSVARNSGMKMATGEWIMFLDSDDWLEATALEIMCDKLQETKAEICICSFVFELGNRQEHFQISNKMCSPRELFEHSQEMTGLAAIMCSPVNKLYSRRILSKYKTSFSDGIRFGEDFIFNVSIFRYIQKVCCVNIPLYHYDCSVEGSGVKHLYPEYDYYIHKMEEALCYCMQSLNISSKLQEEFFCTFISERWQYVTDVCINSGETSQRKAMLLNQWFKTVDLCIIDYLLCENTELKNMYAILKNDIDNITKLKSEIRAVSQSRKRKQLSVALKRIIKKVVRR